MRTSRGLDRIKQFDNHRTVSAQPSRAPRLGDQQFDLIAKALADPTRVAVLEAIGREQECACARLRDAFPVSKATISHHIKELVRAGLVDARRDGQFLHCQVNRDVLQGYAAELLRRVTGANP